MAAKELEPRSDPVVSQGTVPIPDPTKLTTEAVAALKVQLTELFGKEFDGIRREVERLSKEMDARPAAVIQEIKHLDQLMNEKFKGVDQQFAGRDTALAAALLAQKTSVEEQNKSNALSAAKSEAAFEKRIDGVSALISSQTKATDDKITDAKDRITTMESRSAGGGAAINWAIVGVGFILTLISIAGAVIALIK